MRRSLALLLSLFLAAPVRAADIVEPVAEGPIASAPLTPAALPTALPALPALTPVQGLAPAADARAVAPTAAAEAPKAQTVLTAVAGAKEAAPAQAAAYDGSKLPSAAAAPTLAETSAKPAGFFTRLNRATAPRARAEKWFERSVPLGIAAAVAAPVLWKAASPGTVLYAMPLALTAMLLVFGAITFYRAARFLVLRRDVREGAKERSRLAATLAGLALGAMLGAAPSIYQPQILEHGAKIAAPGAELRAVKGDALRQAVIEELSNNPEGRDVLDQLRDRGGVIRLPRFYVAVTRGSIAEHNGTLDVVFINAAEIKATGATVDQFVDDPARQRAFAKSFRSTFIHELRHGDQARRSLREIVDFGDSRESEYEAYITEVRAVHARLQEDPHVRLDSSEFGGYLIALDGYDKFLRHVDGSYPDVHDRSAYYRDFLARARAEWPKFMVEGNLLLAKRNAEHPKIAQMYLDAARKAARDYGLPDPGPNL